MRRPVSSVLVLVLLCAPVSLRAQDLSSVVRGTAVPAESRGLLPSVAEAVPVSASRLLAQGGGSRSSGMHPGLKWTGIALLGAGGLYLGLGAAGDQCADFGSSATCVDRETLLIFGGVLAGAGGALLLIGNAKAGDPQLRIGASHLSFSC